MHMTFQPLRLPILFSSADTLFNYQALQMLSRSLVNFRSSFECKFSSLPNNSTECSKSKCQPWHGDKVPATPLDSGLKLNQYTELTTF